MLIAPLLALALHLSPASCAHPLVADHSLISINDNHGRRHHHHHHRHHLLHVGLGVNVL